ncbi:MAG: VOC family protein [Geminicoccaceae bacterium]
MQHHRGRLIDHIHLRVPDLPAAKRFYRAGLAELGVPIASDQADHLAADELWLDGADSGPCTGRVHLAFRAADRATVERFHRAALAAGGRDNGAPGERPYAPGYYAAFVLDPAGNNIEAVHHGGR